MHSILVLVLLVVVLSVSRLLLVVVLPKYGLALEVLQYCQCSPRLRLG